MIMFSLKKTRFVILCFIAVKEREQFSVTRVDQTQVQTEKKWQELVVVRMRGRTVEMRI